MAGDEEFMAGIAEGVQQRSNFHSSILPDELITISTAMASRVDKHGAMILDHEGQLKSLGSVVASVQSTLSAWTTASTAVGAILIAAVALVAAFVVFGFQGTDGRFDKVDAQIAGMGSRIDDVNANVKLLPSSLSKEILSVAATVATINNSKDAPSGRHR